MGSFREGLRLGKIWSIQFFKDSKVPVVLVFTVLFFMVYITPLRNEVLNSEYGITPYIIPLIYDANTMYMMFVMILLVCDAPFREKNRVFIMARTGRGSWLTGKIIYLLFVSVMLQFLQFIIMCVLLIPYISISPDWGYTLSKAVKYGLTNENMLSGFAANPEVIENFTGLNAYGIQILLNITFTFFSGMIAFVLNGIFKRYIGPIVLVFIAIFDYVITAVSFNMEGMEKLYDYSPLRLIKLSAIISNGQSPYKNMAVLWCISIVLIAAAYVCLRLRVIDRD